MAFFIFFPLSRELHFFLALAFTEASMDRRNKIRNKGFAFKAFCLEGNPFHVTVSSPLVAPACPSFQFPQSLSASCQGGCLSSKWRRGFSRQHFKVVIIIQLCMQHTHRLLMARSRNTLLFVRSLSRPNI